VNATGSRWKLAIHTSRRRTFLSARAMVTSARSSATWQYASVGAYTPMVARCMAHAALVPRGSPARRNMIQVSNDLILQVVLSLLLSVIVQLGSFPCSIQVSRVWSQSRGSPESGFSSRVSLFWRKLWLWALSVLSGLLCNFVAVYLNSVQFILQLKLCLYMIVHLLLEELIISLELCTRSLCHTEGLKSQSESDFGSGVRVQDFYGQSRSQGL